jgi:hypothetical protein
VSKHRFTIKELNSHSDDWVLMKLVADRIEDTTNPYTPFSERLRKIRNNLFEIVSNNPIDQAAQKEEINKFLKSQGEDI